MKNIFWLLVIVIMVLSLLAASCAPSTNATPTAPTKNIVPTTNVPTSMSPTTSSPITPTSTGPEMVKVTLKKLDENTVEKLIEKPKYGGELTLVRESTIYDWDEAYTSTPWGAQTNLGPTHEELIGADWTKGPGGTDEISLRVSAWFDRNYWKGILAESWEIKEPDTIVYHIRKGIHFALNPKSEASRLAAGRELTADDIVFNIKRVFMDIKTAGIYGVAGQSRPLEVSAPNTYTVIMKAPPGQIWMTFENVSDWMEIFNPEVIKKYGDAKDWQNSIGTGPFYVSDYVAMSSVTYVRNPNYWGKDPMFPENQLPYIDTIKYLIIPDASTRMSAIRTGKIDQIGGLGWEDASSLKKTNPELKFEKYFGSVVLPAGRQDKPELPFKDIKVRRALMMAINLQQIKDTYYGGEAVVFAYPVSPVKEWERGFTPLEEIGLAPDGFDTKKIYEYHPDEARQLLTEAGYPNGFKTKVVLGSGSVDLASIVKEYWSKIGVDLFLDVKESSVLKTIQIKKTHEEIYWGGYANVGLPHNIDPNRTGGAFNWAMPNDLEIDARYNKMAALQPRTAEWWKVVKDNNQYVVHRVNYWPLPQQYLMVFWQPWLKGYNGELSLGVWNTIGWVYYTWIDQDLKKSMGH